MGYGSAPPGSPTAYPVPAYARSAPRPPPTKLRSKLFLPSVLLLVAGVLIVVTLGLNWYVVSTQVTTGGSTGTESADYGVASQCVSGTLTSSSSTGCQSYSSAGLSGVANLFATVETLVVVAGLLTFLAGIFGLLGALGRVTFRLQLKLAFLFGIVAALLVLVAPIALAVGLPPAFASGGATATPCGGSTGPQASFFGSCTSSSGSTNLSWYPDVGWYLTFLGFVLGLVGAWRLRKADEHHETEQMVEEEMAAVGLVRPGTVVKVPASVPPPNPYAAPSPWPSPVAGISPMPPPASPVGAPPEYGSPPPAATGGVSPFRPPVAGPYAGGSTGVVCPNCGTVNPPGAYYCGRCQQKIGPGG